MKFFATLKLAKFATELLQSAGFNLAALAEAGNVNALADAIAKKGPSTEAQVALEASLAEVVAANESLTASVTQANARHAALAAAVAAAGVKLPDIAVGAKQEEISAGVTAAIKARASQLATEQLAAAGHPPLTDKPVEETAPKNNHANLKGMDLVRARIADSLLKNRRN